MRMPSIPATFAAVLLTANLFAIDVRLGTWKLNPAKSKFVGGVVIKSQTDVREAGPGGFVQVTCTRELSDGRMEKFTYSYKYDGRAYPAKGASFGSIAVRRVDNQTTKFELAKDGTKYDVRGLTSVSADMRTMTQTIKGVDAAGKPVDMVLVFERK